MKLWGGRFSKSTHQLVEQYNASIGFDHHLAEYDIQGSLAHVEMLCQCNIISADEMEKIQKGLKTVAQKIAQGELSFTLEDEDIHMNIERMLHQEIGPVAGKLHTGRSRNDQVALDMHLYLRKKSIEVITLLHGLLTVLDDIAKQHIDTFIPGYTHLQRAEPVRLAHHMLAYFNMFSRDIQRLQHSLIRINQSPLGAGALAGSGVAVDREFVAEKLHLDGIYSNSLDAVSDRDFVIEFLSNASMIMMHLSRLSEELILWNSQEFSFVQFDDAFCTGSSMMPQKKNPDICELARGKTGRVYGSLMSLLTTLKGLPLAYNKDMQEDKEGLFDTVKTLSDTLAIYAPMLKTATFNKSVMLAATENDFSNATNLANYLVAKNIPFREAHKITGEIVAYCLSEGVLLKELALETYQSFTGEISQDIFDHLTVEAVVEAHSAIGGTARKSVEWQLDKSHSQLTEIQSWLDEFNLE